MAGVITYQMVVDQSGAVKSIQQFDGVLRTSEESIERNTQAIKRNKNALGEQERTANLAGMAALELSHTISDSAYGIQGMANNIGQLVTIFAMMSVQTNAATGAVLGLSGALRATWNALWGPMGLVFVIQALLSWLTVWESKNNAVKKSQDELNDSVGKLYENSTKTSRDIILLIDKVAEGGKVGKEAMKELAQSIPNFEKLRKTMSFEDIAEKYKKYLMAKEEDKRLTDIIFDLEVKRNDWRKQVESARSDGDVAEAKRLGVLLDRNEQQIEQAERLKDSAKTRYLILSELFREEEKRAQKNKSKPPYELIPAPDIDLTKKKYEWEQLVDFINRNPMFSNEALADVRVFAQHLDAISGTMFAMGNTFRNVALIIDDGSEEMEKRLKTLYEIQQGFAIASITVDTLVAMSKVTAETPFLAFLKNAQILAQGVAGVTAVLAQKPGRSSQLKGVKNSSIGTSQDDTVPVTTTGFSNLAGGEKPNQDIRVYVMGSDIRSVQDRSTRTKVRAKL